MAFAVGVVTDRWSLQPSVWLSRAQSGQEGIEHLRFRSASDIYPCPSVRLVFAPAPGVLDIMNRFPQGPEYLPISTGPGWEHIRQHRWRRISIACALGVRPGRSGPPGRSHGSCGPTLAGKQSNTDDFGPQAIPINIHRLGWICPRPGLVYMDGSPKLRVGPEELPISTGPGWEQSQPNRRTRCGFGIRPGRSGPPGRSHGSCGPILTGNRSSFYDFGLQLSSIDDFGWQQY